MGIINRKLFTLSVLRKCLSTLIVFWACCFFGLIRTFKMPLRYRQNRAIRDSAVQLNKEAVQKMNCGAVEKKLYLPKANINLHAVEAGDSKGTLVVLLHGFPDTWHCWHHLIPVLAKKGFLAVAVDMRGYNLSDKPQGVSNYQAQHLARDVSEVITYYKRQKAVVIAHDWGGVVAWNFAEYYPEMIEKLIILNAPHTKAYMREVMSNINQLLASWYIYFFQLPILPLGFASYDPEKTARDFLVTRNKGVVSDFDFKLLAASYAQDECMTSMLNYYRAMGRSVARNLVSGKKRSEKSSTKLDVPVLIIWGENDIALTKETAKCERWVKDVRTVFVPNCSHWIPIDAPAVVEKEVLKFLLPTNNL